MSWALHHPPELPARKAAEEHGAVDEAWGLHQVTTQALAATLGWVRAASPPAWRTGFSRSSPTQSTSPRLRRPAARCAGARRSAPSGPHAEETARASVTSKKTTIRAVSRARRRGWVRAALMTNRFCIPMGAT